MKRAVINVVIFLVVAITAGYIVLDHPTLERQAYAAYQAGDYAKALPLFKKYASTPEVYTNPQKRSEVTLKIVEIERQLSPPATVASMDFLRRGSGESGDGLRIEPEGSCRPIRRPGDHSAPQRVSCWS